MLKEAIFEPIYIRGGFDDKRCLWRFCEAREGQLCSAKSSLWAESFRIIVICCWIVIASIEWMEAN